MQALEEDLAHFEGVVHHNLDSLIHYFYSL